MFSIDRWLPGFARTMAVFLLVVCSQLHAAEYPDRPLRMVVPFPPGGATDQVSRLMAKSMSDALGQPVVVDNRSGAGGIIGAEAVAKAAPDGYTILASTAGLHVVNPAIHERLPYDPVKSWSFIGQAIAAPLVAVVLPTSPFKTLPELIAYAKKNPGKLSYGTAGPGTSNHQTGEMFKHMAGLDILFVPYRGAGPAMNDFFGGRLSMTFSYLGSVYEHAKAGRVRILGVGSPQRIPLIPDVPTFAESGITGFDSDTWTGFVAPAGTPQAVIQKLNQAVAYALKQNREQLMATGYVILGGSSADMNERVATELKTLTPLLARLMAGAPEPPPDK